MALHFLCVREAAADAVTVSLESASRTMEGEVTTLVGQVAIAACQTILRSLCVVVQGEVALQHGSALRLARAGIVGAVAWANAMTHTDRHRLRVLHA